MTFREMNLAVFRGESIPQVFFQPRFEPWLDYQARHGTLPARLAGMELRDAYDLIGASIRYVDYFTGQPHPLEHAWDTCVKVTHRPHEPRRRIQYDTPHGVLYETGDCMTEFPAKSLDDLPALLWLVRHQRYTFDVEAFVTGQRYLGDRGEGQFWLVKSPYFALAQRWMKYEDFIYAFTDSPEKFSDVMKAIDDSYDQLFEQITASRLVKIINFGENVAMGYLTPRYWEEYCIPWYEKRCAQLRRAGIFTHIHIDGFFAPLTPTIRHLPFDGIEALTPRPQGDVSIEEMIDCLGNKILLDGIPAVLFLDHHPMEQLQECVEKIIALKHPRLVLGVSDELPQGGGETAFVRLAWVAERCRAGMGRPGIPQGISEG